MTVIRFDPSAARFPAFRVPVRAGMSLRLLARPRQRLEETGPHAYRLFRRARYALKQAYALTGIGPGTALLAPSYHCRTMLDAASDLGAALCFYRVDEHLRPDLDDVAGKLADPGVPVRAVVFTHFFGHAQDIGPIRELCQRRGVELIEDCSHAMVLGPGSTAQGRIGGGTRIGVSSPYKFIPSADGGLLWVDRSLAASLPAAKPPGWKAELRALRTLLAEAVRGPLPVPSGAHEPTSDAALRLGLDVSEPGDGPSRHYRAEETGIAALASTRWVLRHTDPAAVANARRERYRQWLNALDGVDGARALYPLLDDDTVPYMFPLLLDRPEPSFHALKHRGVPIWRWDEQVLSACPVATRYREALLHLPCHQGLTDAQMGWMADTVRSVLQGLK